MKSLRIAFIAALFAALLPHFAFAASASIDGLSPGTTVPAKQLITFNVLSSGFTAPYYQITDSLPNSSVSTSNINAGGHFAWVPSALEAGAHDITITVRDFSGNVATTDVVITIIPPPSASMTVSPSSAAIPTGTQVAFAVLTPGFTNPTFSLSDNFSGSSLSAVSISPSGTFTWTPNLPQEGDHLITVYVSDSSGSSASASVTVHIGPLPTLTIDNLKPGMNAPVGTTTSFNVRATGYIPTVFGVYDQFSGSTSLSPNAVSNNGTFTWIPQPQDIGVHTITITASIGPFGKSASTTQTYVIYDPAKTGGVVPTVSTVSVTPTSAPAATSAPTPAVSTASGYQFTLSLQNGSTGTEVTQLQSLLYSLGYLSVSPTGYYGPATAAAVVKFQAAKGIAQLGIVGPQTREALNAPSGGSMNTNTQTNTPAPATTTSGDGYVFKNFMGYGETPEDGTDVMELQKRLASLGYFSGDATGYYGNVTVAAVKKFQTAKGIDATGYVGAQTRAALNQ